jgi:hypothetical protein
LLGREDGNPLGAPLLLAALAHNLNLLPALELAARDGTHGRDAVGETDFIAGHGRSATPAPPAMAKTLQPTLGDTHERNGP